MDKKQKVGLIVDKNAFVDEGDGVIRFPRGLTITDDTVQKSGTRYDMDSYDVGSYRGHLTVDHSMSVRDIVGKTFGLAKRASKVTIDGIKFAIKENPVARFTYEMMKAGYLTDFSTETIGKWPDEDGVIYDARLVNLSAVTIGNNDNSNINQLALNTIEQAKKDGLDTSELEQRISKEFRVESNHSNDKERTMELETVKNGHDFPVKVSYKNASGDKVENTLQPGESLDVLASEAKAVKNQIEDAEAPDSDDNGEAGAGAGENTENNDSAGNIEKILNKAIKPLADTVAKLEQNAFDKGATEPGFRKDTNASANSVVNKTNSVMRELANMSWRERAGKQILAGWDALKGKSQEASRTLANINEFNLEQLKKEGVIQNSMTISDFGNFVISKELLSEIEGFRSDYSGILGAVNFRETLSTQFGWLKRSGDVSMDEVEMCDDGADGNLKPVSTYSASINNSNLHELAAVTPVCNAATRFLAADLLEDVAMGYRTDYDRKKAQLLIARLQQAVDATGNKETYNGTSATTRVQSWLNALNEVSEVAMNGIYVFSFKTYNELLRQAIGAGISGPLSTLFTTGDQPAIVGRRYIVVPNDLMPALDSADTLSFTVEGTAVTVDQAVFYFDPATFTGRTSGGLQYDLSTEAAYESGGSVLSAFQRNELVLRGSFFRGGAIRDTAKVASLTAAGVS